MTVDTVLAGWAFVLGRVLFGGVLAFNGLNHFMQTEQMAAMADANDVPWPTLAVYGTGSLLLLGGLSLVTGIYPVVGAVALVVFFVVTTPWMHDFWNIDDNDQKQQQLTHFMKNSALLGAALVLFSLTAAGWPMSAGVQLL